MKKDYKHGKIYANDLLAWVGIPSKDNDNLLMELTDLFSSYAEENVKQVYQDIMFVSNVIRKGKPQKFYTLTTFILGINFQTKDTQ